jgi:hypothetical protein
MFCALQLAEFRPHIPTLREAGVDLAVIGSGAPHFARGFKEHMQLDVPVYCDEQLAVYRAAALHRGLRYMLDPRQVGRIPEATKYFSLQLQGDATQQGGALLVTPDGSVPYRHANRWPGDHAAAETVVAAALKAAMAR